MASATASPPLTPIPVLLELAAAARPDAVAAIDEGGSHTYAELLGRVSHLADRLAVAGVGLEDRVGVMMRPSAELLVAVLAIMRAGAAFVPIDPGYPAERRRFLTADSGMAVLIADDEPDSSVPMAGADGVRVLRPDGGMATRCGVPHRAGPGNLACIIYTSGTTGVPKGVMITCRGLANLATAAAGRFALRHADRYVMLASPSFSAALEELFPPLVVGATAVFPPDRPALYSAAGLLEFVEDHAITLAELQTTQWHLLVRHLTETGRRPPSSLRLLVVGGERPLPDAFDRWRASGLPIVHVYGPTETTATATYADIDPATPSDGPMPIGRAIPGARLFVVAEHGGLAEPGSPGELYVGGDALARGYLGRPGATAEQFVPDPFSGEPGAVLYRTGDLVRERPDGQLVFLERVDHQVKVRGYRVEPIEVEQALQRHPAVAEAVVAAREDVPGHRRLVAYLTGGEVTPLELRRFLADLIPAYMIPSAFVRLAELPLTPHRKLDRAALPAPARQRPDIGTPFVPPTDQVEENLCALWADLLRVDEIGVTDDFLALGGDSLLTLRLITKIDSRFGVRLTPRQAFAERTVRGLADLLRDRAGTAHEDVARLRERRLALAAEYGRRHGRAITAPAAAVQQGMWLLSRLFPDSPVNNTPWLCRLRGTLDPALLCRALRILVDRHEVLSAAFPELDGEILQASAGEVEIEEVDLRDVADADRRAFEYATALGRRPFDVTTGPLLRIAVVRLAADNHLLVWGVHHLIIDLRSQQVMLQELADIYQALRGAGNFPPEPAVQYADLSAHERWPGSQEARRKSLEFWRQELADLPTLSLPVSGSAFGYEGADHRFWLPAALADGAVAFGLDTGTSTFTVLITAYAEFLRRWTGTEDLAVVTPFAGRTDPRAADTVGLLTVTGALRIRPRPDIGFRDLLAETWASALAAYDHQDVSLEHVVEMMGRSASQNRFRALFSLQTDAAVGLTWPGITAGPTEDLPTGTTRLDLSLIFHQRSDGVCGRLEYRTGLMDETTAIDVADRYCAVLAEVLADPGRRLSAAPVSAWQVSTKLSGAR